MYTVRPRTFERDADRERVLAETTWTNRTGPDPIVETIVETIAEIEAVDPLEIGPLYDHIDPDIVADLRSQNDSQWQLLFYTDDYEIRVNSQGTVTIYHTDVRDDEPVITAASDVLSDGRR
ncbi:hypothetical protein SAMN05216278_3211 [Halopelagius longus]|nr:hypothetical protein SAMN05216278_3211 [Halopelagius longus]